MDASAASSSRSNTRERDILTPYSRRGTRPPPRRGLHSPPVPSAARSVADKPICSGGHVRLRAGCRSVCSWLLHVPLLPISPLRQPPGRSHAAAEMAVGRKRRALCCCATSRPPPRVDSTSLAWARPDTQLPRRLERPAPLLRFSPGLQSGRLAHYLLTPRASLSNWPTSWSDCW